MKIKCFVLPVLLLLPALAFAQTAAEMDNLLASGTVSAAQAARFVLGAADLLPQGLSEADAENAAYDTAFSNGWVKAAPGESITYKETAFLIMKAFNIKGGVMYSIFKNPRYAYREMVYRKLIQGRTEGAMPVTGARFLLVLDRVLRYAERGDTQ